MSWLSRVSPASRANQHLQKNHFTHGFGPTSHGELKVHVDIAGPFLGKSFFILVDAHFN